MGGFSINRCVSFRGLLKRGNIVRDQSFDAGTHHPLNRLTNSHPELGDSVFGCG